MKKILIIDDDPNMNQMIKRLLEENGYEARSEFNGDDGWNRFLDEAFDLIITDIIMPRKEGIELIRAIREKSQTLPIIAISGGGRLIPDTYLSMAQNMGADYIFAKPFDHALFLGAVRECLT